jgi:hypothetical protein
VAFRYFVARRYPEMLSSAMRYPTSWLSEDGTLCSPKVIGQSYYFYAHVSNTGNKYFIEHPNYSERCTASKI